MKKYILLPTAFLCFYFLSSTAFARSFDLLEVYHIDIEIRKVGMAILGVWALGNIVIGSMVRNRLEGEKAYFHEMNVFWNIINLVIAGAGYYFTITGAVPATGAEQLSGQIEFQKILLFNCGLDIAYIMGGIYLLEKAKNISKKPLRLKGYGKSVILQGIFLFVFDLLLYSIHQNNTISIVELIGN
ncbi:hypothetical protein GCM10011506_05920 [Marivirga lumbricoides]|uniref:Uncharacterized protein n=1 Tax=Marivirga lumbricoides TaxID=1046115 RepID=A0ABQ1LDR7_9BACT|nr:hypothetical protein GCM10011506_05920 [Marivirga lumbricoides]